MKSYGKIIFSEIVYVLIQSYLGGLGDEKKWIKPYSIIISGYYITKIYSETICIKIHKRL